MDITFNDDELEVFKGFLGESFSSLKFKVANTGDVYFLSAINDLQASNGFSLCLDTLPINVENIEKDRAMPLYFGITMVQKDSLNASFTDKLSLDKNCNLSFGDAACLVTVPASECSDREKQEVEEMLDSNVKDCDAGDTIDIDKGSRLFEVIKNLKDAIYTAYKESSYLVTHDKPISDKYFSKSFTFIPVIVNGINKVLSASCESTVKVGWSQSTAELFVSAGYISMRMIDYQDNVTTSIDYDTDVKQMVDLPSKYKITVAVADFVKKLDRASKAVASAYYAWKSAESGLFQPEANNVNCSLNFAVEKEEGKLDKDVQIKFDIASIKPFLNGSEKSDISFKSGDDSIGEIATDDSEIYIFAEEK